MPSAGELERQTVNIADVPIELFQGGSGDPLLILHGGEGFAPLESCVRMLAQHHRVVVPLHPGFGHTPLPDWADSVDDVVHLYLALLDRLGLRQVDAIGCSFGGWVAAEMATKSFDLIRNLVLVGPVGIKIGPVDRLDIPDVFAMAADKLQGLLFHDPAAHRIDPAALSDEQAALMARSRETLALMTWEPYMHNPKLKHRLPNLNSRTLLIRGESDGLVSADYLAGYAALIPGAQTLTIAQAGHVPYRERPQEFTAAVRTFLDRQSAQG